MLTETEVTDFAVFYTTAISKHISFFFFFLQSSRGSGKVHSFGKRDHSIKRNLNVPVVVRGWLYKQVSCSQSQVTLRIMLMNRRNITVQNVSVIHLLCEECSLSRLKKTKKLNSEKNSLSVCVCCDLVSSRWTWQLISSFSALKLLPLITYFIQTMMYGNKKRILRVSLLCTTLGVVQKKSITWGFFFPHEKDVWVQSCCVWPPGQFRNATVETEVVCFVRLLPVLL